jgi:hypothetical protein
MNFILAIVAFSTGIVIAKLFKLLFVVRYNQLQRILVQWFKAGEP